MNQEKQYFIAVFQLRLLSAQFGGDFGGQPPDCSLVLILLVFASDWSEQKRSIWEKDNCTEESFFLRPVVSS